MHSVHDTVSGRAAIKHEGAAQQTISLTDLASVAASRILGFFEPPSYVKDKMRGQWPWDPFGELVPDWNSELYRSAQEAYRGSYLAKARRIVQRGVRVLVGAYLRRPVAQEGVPKVCTGERSSA